MLANDARFEKGKVFSRRSFLRLPEHPEDLWPLAVQAFPVCALFVGAANVAWCWARARWAGRGRT